MGNMHVELYVTGRVTQTQCFNLHYLHWAQVRFGCKKKTTACRVWVGRGYCSFRLGWVQTKKKCGPSRTRSLSAFDSNLNLSSSIQSTWFQLLLHYKAFMLNKMWSKTNMFFPFRSISLKSIYYNLFRCWFPIVVTTSHRVTQSIKSKVMQIPKLLYKCCIVVRL